MKEKKKSTLSKLMVFAGNHKYYVYDSCILATISAFMALVPFYDIWRIIKEVLEVRPHFNEAVHIKNYGGHAVLFALLSMIFYIFRFIPFSWFLCFSFITLLTIMSTSLDTAPTIPASFSGK